MRSQNHFKRIILKILQNPKRSIEHVPKAYGMFQEQGRSSQWNGILFGNGF